jgi:hypothetical protein
MTDITLISVFGFSLIKVVLWIIVVLYSMAVIRKIYQASTSEDQADLSPIEGAGVVYQNRWRIIRWFLFLVIVILYTANESAYRPKTVINPPNPALQEYLRAIDNAPPPEVEPAGSLAPQISDPDALKENRRSNAAARQEFEKLPDAPE